MAHSALNRLSNKQLRRWLMVFFCALVIPSGVLVYQAYDQLKWEAFHRHQVVAEELASRIDKHYIKLIQEEEQRAFVDYNFLLVTGNQKNNLVQRSPLSNFPVQSSIPGLIGYFQVDSEGLFKTPLLPDSIIAATEYGIKRDELTKRQQLANRVRDILSKNQLIRGEKSDYASDKLGYKMDAVEQTSLSENLESLSSSSHETRNIQNNKITAAEDKVYSESEISTEVTAGQAVFDRLGEQNRDRKKQLHNTPNSLGRVEDLQLDSSFEAAKQAPQPLQIKRKSMAKLERLPRKELSTLAEPEAAPAPAASSMMVEKANPTPLRIHTFESEIDPFEMSLLDSGHIVLYRKVWRDGQRIIQGALIDQAAFLTGVIQASFNETSLAQMSNLLTAYLGNVLTVFSSTENGRDQPGMSELHGALLYQTRLTAPLNDMELIFTIQNLPAGAGGMVIAWVTVILLFILTVGFYGIYRLGLGQINLIAQQQDFVSAVSHELKTPLTSIRMYGEILREGWANEDKKHEYYNYIHDESERLTRLINNVLQLARMTRNDLQVQFKSISAGELVDTINSKISSQVSRAGFKLKLNCSKDCSTRMLQVDPDYFVQIIINLVDNAIKFSAKAENKCIDIECCEEQGGMVVFKVRDYGPGIPKDQMKKIFKLFYRSESELTRETVGTGIGLALVNQLTTAMSGKIDVVSVAPGVEFRVSFKP
ncbi:MAG: ATP-binding protein [Candidatus Thiodiazotropha sp.]